MPAAAGNSDRGGTNLSEDWDDAVAPTGLEDDDELDLDLELDDAEVWSDDDDL